MGGRENEDGNEGGREGGGGARSEPLAMPLRAGAPGGAWLRAWPWACPSSPVPWTAWWTLEGPAACGQRPARDVGVSLSTCTALQCKAKAAWAVCEYMCSEYLKN
jgi:hypothetical protein